MFSGASRFYTTPRATARSSKKTKPSRNQTRVEWNVIAKARQEWAELLRAHVRRRARAASRRFLLQRRTSDRQEPASEDRHWRSDGRAARPRQTGRAERRILIKKRYVRVDCLAEILYFNDPALCVGRCFTNAPAANATFATTRALSTRSVLRVVLFVYADVPV